MLSDMEVEIVSRKLITPSAHNEHPRSVKLSFFDQLAPPTYVDTIFYYAAATCDHLERLKKSLSETLSVFYPLAGRYLEDDVSIECNDQGVEFLEAQVKGQLDHLDKSDAELLGRFVPPSLPHSSSTPLLSIQVNMFECGGFAIGVHISHLVADAYTISLFTNEWASACRSGSTDQILHPSFNLASIFPSRDVFAGCPSGPRVNPSFIKPVTRRFVFDGKAISRLRASCAQRPSRVQVVTALLWRALMRCSQARREEGNTRASLLSHMFNMRGRTNLPVADYSCGNLFLRVLAWNGEAKTELQDLAGIVSDAFKNAAAETAKSLLHGDDVFLLARDAVIELNEAIQVHKMDVFRFTSWCRMRLYEVDFGRGKPDWMSVKILPLERLVVLMDTKNGDGIEAWVSLAEEDLASFEQDPDIVFFAHRDGSK